jgi:predicted RNA-binding protein YlxR (DUF448 family)
MAVRKIPMRKCIACGIQKPKKELIRIVRTPEQKVFIDPKGKVSGRGAYLCASQECFDLAMKKKALTRALEVEITPEDVQQLKDDWTGMLHGRK